MHVLKIKNLQTAEKEREVQDFDDFRTKKIAATQAVSWKKNERTKQKRRKRKEQRDQNRKRQKKGRKQSKQRNRWAWHLETTSSIERSIVRSIKSKGKKTCKIKKGILRKSIDTIRGVRKSLLETLSNSSNRIDRLSENTSLYFPSLFSLSICMHGEEYFFSSD